MILANPTCVAWHKEKQVQPHFEVGMCPCQ